MDNPARTPICQAMEHTDIIIVGGGLNGPVLALAAAQSGFRVTVIDAVTPDTHRDRDFDGRAYAIALGSMRLLRGVGVWDAVKPDAQPMLDIKVTDGRAGEGASPWMMHFDHAEIEEGPMGWLVEDRHLRAALLDAIGAQDRITHLTGRSVMAQAVTGGGVTVTLDGDDTLAARLLVGCDGRTSGVAKRAGIKRTGWDYDQIALVCAVEHDLPHHGVAHQFFMPGGPLAILPLTGNRSSVVWSEQADRARATLARDDGGFLAALRPAFGSFLGEIRLVGQRFSYPLGLTLADSLIAPRTALVGDAAHGIHPIAGQGLNAGLRDVAALAQVMEDARMRGEDIGSAVVLDRYQVWRRFEATRLAIATDAFNRLFSNDNPVLRGLRDLGMGAINAMPGLRRRFIREAAGLTGDLPRLMR
ncbi:UbiH/UbiF/VisC/COQ6 family ubiquinone biosynthesis hydroxylase [Loktanella sp. M215]|uniref:UbiH/UbiF/VisC/COQ6 family ubiquinone biosynthesis hydroxylase n=1 Tax=Loktanella sp. M215 TaxID=2675431 RepID=UPI001F4092D7|nr:UbiH/UbiF/VisC/COQ6 family ubiquinone biosynthesis hydroxylase [Loktanella sp. M215]MCF7698541.1 2-octaprenyl-6-methoxyphenyl hydroxylase [Loktanella sp. M215]